jgi:hypothetical protein
MRLRSDLITFFSLCLVVDRLYLKIVANFILNAKKTEYEGRN